MLEGSAYISIKIIDFHLHFRLGLRHRKEEYIFKGFAQFSSLLCSLPFLKQSRKGLTIQSISGLSVCHKYLSVTANRNLFQVDPASCPSIKTAHLIKRYLRCLVSSGEDIVHSEGLERGLLMRPT